MTDVSYHGWPAEPNAQNGRCYFTIDDYSRSAPTAKRFGTNKRKEKKDLFLFPYDRTVRQGKETTTVTKKNTS